MKNTFLILSLLLFLAVIFSTGCGGNGNSVTSDKADSTQTTSEDSVKTDTIIVEEDVTIPYKDTISFVGKKTKEFDSAWCARANFDLDLYLGQLSDVSRWAANGQLKSDEELVLRSFVKETAITVACNGYNGVIDAWTSRSEHIMCLNVEGLRRIKTDFSVNYPKIKEIEDIDTLYKTICSFVRDIKITPEFNGTTWKSFYSIRESNIKKAQNLSTDALFPRLKNVPVVTDSLDVKKLKERINRHENSFYRKLDSTIESYYTAKLPWNETDLQKLNEVIYPKLNKESSYYGGKLWNFIDANTTHN